MSGITPINQRFLRFIPKISYEIEKSILRKLTFVESKIGDYVVSNGANEIVYHSVGRYWLKAFDFVPVFRNEKSGVTRSTKYKSLYFNELVNKDVLLALINSSLFYWYWITMSAARNFTKKDICDFPFDILMTQNIDAIELHDIIVELMRSYQEHSIMQETNGVNGKTVLQEFHPSFNKSIIDKIEPVIGRMYGFTEEEINYLVNYDLRFRMGDEEN